MKSPPPTAALANNKPPFRAANKQDQEELIMKPSTKNRAKGAATEAKGRMKAAVGKATRSQRLRAKGNVEAVKGRAQRKVGQAQRDLE